MYLGYQNTPQNVFISLRNEGKMDYEFSIFSYFNAMVLIGCQLGGKSGMNGSY